MDALVLAAGQGSRLKRGCPKCLIEIGGRPLIHRQLDALYGAGVERVIVVAGYQLGRVRRALPSDAVIVPNRLYAETNSLYSFWLARGEVGDDVLVLNSDVLFPSLLAGLPWVEIDFPEDLAYARACVAPAIDRLESAVAA